jgi:hypothetical protein
MPCNGELGHFVAKVTAAPVEAAKNLLVARGVCSFPRVSRLKRM